MDTKGYCKLCGKIKSHFCCQSCYDQDATKSTKKSAMQREIIELRTTNAELLDVLKELFEQCSMVHKYGGDGSNQKESDSAISAALAAIAKATS